MPHIRRTDTSVSPARIADMVMSALAFGDDAEPDEEGRRHTFLTVRLDKEDFPFFLCWEDCTGGRHHIIVALMEDDTASEGTAVLGVELYDLTDFQRLKKSMPLDKQVLHRVNIYEPGPWIGALNAALVAKYPQLFSH